MATKKLSPTQETAVAMARDNDGLHRVPGGFWIAGNEAKWFRGMQWFTVQTIEALVRRGVFAWDEREDAPYPKKRVRLVPGSENVTKKIYQVIIVGNFHEVEKAVAERGVELLPLTARKDAGSTVADVLADLSTLADWLAEEPRQPPYPVGTLLWYGAK